MTCLASLRLAVVPNTAPMPMGMSLLIHAHSRRLVICLVKSLVRRPLIPDSVGPEKRERLAAERMPATLELTLVTAIPILLLSIWLGTLSALNKDKFIDQFLRVFSVLGYSIPTFVLGIVLLAGGQMILQHVFGFDTALSIIIEFAGGIVFLAMLLRGKVR